MTKKPDELAVLADMNRERDELDAAIEEMIAGMAEAPEGARTTGDWASDGAFTRKYLELTNRQAELEREIAALSREISAANKPAN